MAEAGRSGGDLHQQTVNSCANQHRSRRRPCSCGHTIRLIEEIQRQILEDALIYGANKLPMLEHCAVADHDTASSPPNPLFLINTKLAV